MREASGLKGLQFLRLGERHLPLVNRHSLQVHTSGQFASSVQSERKRNFVVWNQLYFWLVGAVFNCDCPGKSRLKAAPTNHYSQLKGN